MFRRITLVSTLAALSLSACVVLPPPGPRHQRYYSGAEVGVAPGPGWFWVSGYWQPSVRGNVWIEGHWSRR